ncbi:MAG: glycosyltransferase [Candidatus Omnitrophica bacterium]|nr:glycosyltransferase [Candidatus Omnitrophota bacterium]
MQIVNNLENPITEKKENLLRPVILILSPFLPFPPRDGGKLKMYTAIKSLSDEYDIILLSFIEDVEEERFTIPLRIFCREVFTILRKPTSLTKRENDYFPKIVKAFYSQEFKNKLEETIKKYTIDILQTEYTFMAYYTKDIQDIPRILVEHDTSLFSLLHSYEKPLENGVFRKFSEWLKKVRFHRYAYEQFDKIIVFTEEEKKKIKRLVPDADVSVIPIGLDLLTYNFPKRDNNQPLDLIFIGYMGHYPNVDGVFYFCDRILPLIHSELPEVSLYIIGSSMEDRLLKLKERKNIYLLGEVEDIRLFLAKSKVFIAPLRYGGGLRVKILEAMAMGLPVVATSVASRGIRAIANKEIIISDTPKKFAKDIIQLIQNENLRKELGSNAHLAVRQYYDSDKIKERFKFVYNFI